MRRCDSHRLILESSCLVERLEAFPKTWLINERDKQCKNGFGIPEFHSVKMYLLKVYSFFLGALLGTGMQE